MHEVGLMREVIDAAVAEAARHRATRVHSVTLRVGALAGVEPEALAFAFEVAAAGTPAEGAALTIEPVPVRCHCPFCMLDFDPAGWVFRCPKCATLRVDRVQGDELDISSLEVS